MQTTEPRCLVCELEQDHSPSELEEEAIAEHEWRIIKLRASTSVLILYPVARHKRTGKKWTKRQVVLPLENI
jgi:hypothetical protein